MEIDRARSSFHIGQSRPWKGRGVALPRCSSQSACTTPPPQIIQASRSHAAWGWGQPALGSQTFTWAMAQARLGSRGRRKIHSRLLLGHQLGRLCAKLLIVRAQQAFLTRPTQGRHCSQSDLASEEKILQHNCARLSPLPELLYGYTCVSLYLGNRTFL